MRTKTLCLNSLPVLLGIIFSLASYSTFAQRATAINRQANDTSVTVSLNLTNIITKLRSAPSERSQAARTALQTILLPMPDGTQRLFYVERNNVMSDDFARKAPELKTYTLRAVDDATVYGRLTVSPAGLRATIFVGNQLVDIAPVNVKNPVLHTSRLSRPGASTFECGVVEKAAATINQSMRTTARSNGAVKRTYRIAIVTTVEFYVTYGSSEPAAQAKVAAIINSLNAIYERELAVSFVLLTPYIYKDPATDPWASGQTDRLERVAGAIGANFTGNSYDIGHAIHSTGGDASWGGGVAGLGVLCNNGPVAGYTNAFQKSRGWSSMPGTDPLQEINILAHEIGHQFSMPHSWNAFCTAAPGNQIGDAYEIGSGTTIMSYDQVCDQANSNIRDGWFPVSNQYFHNISLNRAMDHMANNASCGTTTTTGNTPPVVNAKSCGNNFILPKGTPFKLMGSGSDADGDKVYYNWEQFDEDGPGNPTQGKMGADAAADPLAPLFRSYPPTTDASRTFPAMALVLANDYASRFEPLPTVARSMKFRLTGRDYSSSGGALDYDEVLINVSSFGPFTVSSLNGGNSIAAGTAVDVSWNLNGINFLNNVRIKLSVDGGYTYPYILSNSTAAADGIENVMIPAGVPNTTKARIMVESADQNCFTFFDVSDDFTVTSSCNTTPHTILDITPVSAVAGNAALHLSPQIISGQVSTALVMTPAGSASMIYNLNPQTPGLGSCHNVNWTNKYDHKRIMVDKSGNYSFTIPTVFGVVSLYSNSFAPATPCTNYLGSNAYDHDGTPGGTLSYAYTVTFNLAAGTQYEIVYWDPNNAGVANISISGVGNLFVNNSSQAAGYLQTFVAVNVNSGNIDAVNADANFTTLAAGSYSVYGIAYYNGTTPPAPANPSTWVGNNLASLLSNGTCLGLSSNAIPLTVLATGTPDLTVSSSPSMNEGANGTTAFTFTVTRTGNLSNASGVDWAVTASGTNPANAADLNGAFPSGIITFPANAVSRTITIDVAGDAEIEADETFTLTLSNPVNATVSMATGIGVIVNDDVPTISTFTQANCAVPTASATLVNLPSTGNWTLTRNPGAITTTGSGTSTTVSGLAPGTYTFTLTIGSYTTPSSANVIIEMDKNPRIQEVADGVDNNCNGMIDENNGLQFDGVKDYLKVDNVTYPQTMTLQGWMKANGFSGTNNRVILQWTSNNGSGADLYVEPNGNIVYSEYSATGGWHGYGLSTLPTDGAWHHYAIVRNQATGTIRFYRDGVETGWAPMNKVIDATTLQIGGFNGQFFGGAFDEWSQWNYAKTAAQIQSDVAACADGTDNAAAMFYFDFNQGIAIGNNVGRNMIYDFSGKNLTGTLYGFDLTGRASNFVDGRAYPLWYRDADSDGFGIASNSKRSCSQPAGYVAIAGDCDDANAAISPNAKELPDGIDNNCNGTVDENTGLHFDGVNDYVKSGTVTKAANAAITMEAWFKLDEVTGNNRTIMAWQDAATGRGFMIGVNSNGGFRYLEKTTANGGWGGVNWGNVLDLNWHHIAIVRNAGATTTSIYFDGSLFGPIPTDNSFSTTDVIVGMFGTSSEFFKGTIDEVKVWNIAKTQTQIQEGRNCTGSASASNLVLYYDFNQGTPQGNNTLINQVADYSGSNANGLLYNLALTGATSNFVDGYTGAEINVKGNGSTIYTGDVTPLTTDNTDFGATTTGTAVTRSFTIENTGTKQLSVTAITVNGGTANGFTTNFTNTINIAAGGNATFTVTFNPTGAGLKTDVIKIVSNDCDEALYTFTVSGSAGCTLAQAPALTKLSSTNVACTGGNDGTLRLKASGGSGTGYTFALNNGAYAAGTSADEMLFTNLAAGTYTVAVKDGNGCTTTSTFIITAPTGTKPDVNLTTYTYLTSFPDGSSRDMVLTLTEIGGHPAQNVKVYLTDVAGYTYSLPSVATITLGSTTYTVDNASWTKTSAGGYTVLQFTLPSAVINCSQSLNLGLRITRSGGAAGFFPLSSVVSGVTSETNTTNNTSIRQLTGH